jgi:pyruvate kinase
VLKPGNRILLSDGQMELQVVQVRSKEIDTKVVLGGKLTSNKGVNLPGALLIFPGFTEKTSMTLAYGLEHGIDIIAVLI